MTEIIIVVFLFALNFFSFFFKFALKKYLHKHLHPYNRYSSLLMEWGIKLQKKNNKLFQKKDIKEQGYEILT